MFLRDNSTPNKTSLTNPPPITNKGRERTREVGIKEKTNSKEVTSKPTLQTKMAVNPLHRIPSVPLNLGRTHSYRLIICVLFVTPIAITLINVLTWLASNNFSKTTVNMICSGSAKPYTTGTSTYGASKPPTTPRNVCNPSLGPTSSRNHCCDPIH